MNMFIFWAVFYFFFSLNWVKINILFCSTGKTADRDKYRDNGWFGFCQKPWNRGMSHFDNLVPRGPFCHALEKSGPVADQKDRGLWERDWYLYYTVELFAHALLSRTALSNVV